MIADDKGNQLTTDIVLIRLIEYVRLTGIEVDDALLFELAAIVQEGSKAEVSTLFDWSLQRLNGRICDTRPLIASPIPRIRRGQIGYDADAGKVDNARASK